MDTASINRRRRQLTYRTLVTEQRRTIRLLQQTVQPARGTAETAGLRVTAAAPAPKRTRTTKIRWRSDSPH